MKKAIIFFVLLLGFSCFSQENAAELLNEGTQEIANKNYTTAISLLKQSASAAKESGDSKTTAKAYAALGEAFQKNDNPAAALQNYLLALPEAKKVKDTRSAAVIAKEIGALYATQKKYELSLQYYNEAAQAGKQLTDEALTAEAVSGAGSAYEELHQIDKALESYSQALAIYRARGMELLAGNTLSKMGNAYKKHGDYPQSVLNYKEALGYFNSANDKKKVADVLNSLGGVLAMMEDHNESLRLYEQAYLDAVAMQYDEVVISASLGMANAYENLRQYPESVRYHKIYEQKKESYDNRLRAQETAMLKEKYARQSADGGDVVQTASADTAGVTISEDDYIILAVGTGALLIVFVVIGFLWRRKLLKKAKEDNMFNEAEGQERLRLVQNLHDDLDSKLEEINSLSESIVERSNGMPTIKLQGEAMQETTKKIEENTRDLVWLLTPKTTTLTNYVDSIKEYVHEYFGDSPIDVMVSQPEGISNTIITKETQLGLLSVIKESLVFVKEDTQATKMFFGITYSGTRLMVSIKDNGKGNDISDADKKRLDGHLSPTGGIMRRDCDPGWGSVIKIIIPIEKTTKAKKVPVLNFNF